MVVELRTVNPRFSLRPALGHVVNRLPIQKQSEICLERQKGTHCVMQVSAHLARYLQLVDI